MKRNLVSIAVAFLAMVFSCAAVFADTVVFDKKNKGNEKDFVESEFSSIKELEALCKKYPKNNAEVLVKFDDDLTVKYVTEMNNKINEIHKCFKTELDLMSFGPSTFNKKGNVYVFKFTYENGKYSPKYSLIESNVVAFFDLTLTDNDYRNQNYFFNKLANAVNNQQKIEFNSVKEFEKLYKDHKKNSFCIVIPASSRIRNETNLEKLSKLVFDDASKIKKNYMSYFASNAPVVIESYVSETQNSIDTGDIFGLISSIASSAKVTRDIYVYKESESVVLQVEAAILDNERNANEKSGLGKLTNAEVEKERKKNEAAGRGRLTNAEILTAERKTNEKAGLGKLTNAEVEKERKTNEAAGLGKLTNTEVNTERVKNEKAGLGKITNAEAEKERKENEAAGRGKLTNTEFARKLEDERNANEKAGLGKLTNEEVEKERSQNEAAGRGRITNAELAKKLDDERIANEKAGLGRITNSEVENERKSNAAAGRGKFTNAELKEQKKQLFMKKIPTWMGNSEILFTDYFWRSSKTVFDFFCSPKDTTSVTVKYSDNELILYHEVIANGILACKVELVLKFSKNGNSGVCYISKFYMEVPRTFNSKLLTCYNPYNDSGNYAEILGALYAALPILYD